MKYLKLLLLAFLISNVSVVVMAQDEKLETKTKYATSYKKEKRFYVGLALRLAQGIVGIALGINLINSVKTISEGRGDGLESLFQWITVFFVYLVFMEFLISSLGYKSLF